MLCRFIVIGTKSLYSFSLPAFGHFLFFLAFQWILFWGHFVKLYATFSPHLMRLNIFSLHFFLSCIPSACLRKIDTCSCFSQGACTSVDTSEIISLDFNSWLALSSNQTEKELLRMVTNIILSCLHINDHFKAMLCL